MYARWKIIEIPSQSGMKSKDRILTLSGKFRYEIRTLKKCRLRAGSWMNPQALEKKLRGKSLGLPRLPYTPETTLGIVYVVLAYNHFVFLSVMEQKGVQEREKRSKLL